MRLVGAVWCVLILTSVWSAAALAAPDFTGDVPNDFDREQSRVIADDPRWPDDVGIPSDLPVKVSGFDMGRLWLHYDTDSDTLYVGIEMEDNVEPPLAGQTRVLAGDADNDGDPSVGTRGRWVTRTRWEFIDGEWVQVTEDVLEPIRDYADFDFAEYIGLVLDVNNDGIADYYIGVPEYSDASAFGVYALHPNMFEITIPFNELAGNLAPFVTSFMEPLQQDLFVSPTCVVNNGVKHPLTVDATKPDVEFVVSDFSSLLSAFEPVSGYEKTVACHPPPPPPPPPPDLRKVFFAAVAGSSDDYEIAEDALFERRSAVTHLVWLDSNENEQPDAGELAIPNVTNELRWYGLEASLESTTDAQGLSLFEDLYPSEELGTSATFVSPDGVPITGGPYTGRVTDQNGIGLLTSRFKNTTHIPSDGYSGKPNAGSRNAHGEQVMAPLDDVGHLQFGFVPNICKFCPPCGNNRTIGFWKNNCRKARCNPSSERPLRGMQVAPADLVLWLRMIGTFHRNEVFGEFAPDYGLSDKQALKLAYYTLRSRYPGVTKRVEKKCCAQLLAAEFNYISVIFSSRKRDQEVLLLAYAEDVLAGYSKYTPGTRSYYHMVARIQYILDRWNNQGD